MIKLVIFPFLFAAASAGLIGAPLTSYPVGHATFASPLAVGVAHAPLVPAPAIYNAPIVKHVTPVAYSAPVVKTVIPAATSYANTYRVSHSATPVLSHAVGAPFVSHAVATPVYSHAVPTYAIAAPSAYSHGISLLH